MSHSLEGPHKGEIRLPGGKRVSASKRNGKWYAGGKSVKTGLFFDDDLALKELRRLLETGAAKKPTRKWWQGEGGKKPTPKRTRKWWQGEGGKKPTPKRTRKWWQGEGGRK